jgi:hypothetical protein
MRMPVTSIPLDSPGPLSPQALCTRAQGPINLSSQIQSFVPPPIGWVATFAAAASLAPPASKHRCD